MMEAVPVETPPIIPVDPMVATAVLPLLQLPPPELVPPLAGSISALVDPGQTWATPVILGGVVFIVIVVVAAQPSGSV